MVRIAVADGAGLRVSEVANPKVSGVDSKRMLRAAQGKGKGPALDPLAEAVSAAARLLVGGEASDMVVPRTRSFFARHHPASLTGDLTFLVTTQARRPFTAAGFGNWFHDRCNGAGMPDCSAHGSRKTGATIAAENGATGHERMAGSR